MSIADEFKGLPIEELVAAPLIAAGTSQARLAALTADFIERVGLEEDGKVKTVKFSYASKKGDGQDEANDIEVPLLSIVNVPNLSVKRAEVNFTMEVKAQSMDKSSTEANASTEVKASSWFSPCSVKISGSVTTKSEHTRSTDKSAKYDIKVEARDDGLPEGLAKTLDMLAATINNPAHKQG